MRPTGDTGRAQFDGLAGVALEELRGAALERAAELGCSHAEVRVERIRSQYVALRDGRVETTVDDTELGIGLHVVRNGSIGFAATVELTAGAAAALAEAAVGLATRRRRPWARRVEIAPEPAHGDVRWSSPYEVDPTSVPLAEKVALLEQWCAPPAAVGRGRPRLGPGAVRRGGQALRRSVGDGHHPAPGAHPPRRRGRRRRRRRRGPSSRCGRWPRRWAAAGSTPPATAGTSPPSSTRCPSSWPRRWPRPRSRPGPTTSSSTPPTCGSPSTSRWATPPSSTAPSATRPPTPGRRSPPSTSSAPCATARP